MTEHPELEEVSRRLDQLIVELAGGAHRNLEEKAAWLAGCTESLQRLLDAARAGERPAGAAATCGEIRRRIALIREMLAHAQQVRAGLAGIIALLYEADAGSQYSACGAPTLHGAPRILAEA